MITDPHSFARPEDAYVTHLQWSARIDFVAKKIVATATWAVLSTPSTKYLILDIKGLEIKNVFLDDGNPAEYVIGTNDPLLGSALRIKLYRTTTQVSIDYQTGQNAEALQWLDPVQTAGKQHPFLFTQSQAILARSWIPCQDTPGVRFSYQAKVVVPPELLPVMSASNPQALNSYGIYQFEMNQSIPSYLLALAVGDIVYSPISNRCGVYAEPATIESARWEFGELERMVCTAESLYGEYPWERYDIIVLPPSFPFGGMENPRLTFVTPTIIAGDRSLTSLIAHELAHSWSGNLVTNRTWNDFWLNEGFTVYFEHRIMEKIYGRDFSEMLAALALHDLTQTIDDLRSRNLYDDTRLKLNLAGRDPDEGVTDIAYNKGYFLLRLIEERFGRELFDGFLNRYFSDHRFAAMDTDQFIMYIQDHYRRELKQEIDFLTDWIFEPGLPDSCPKPKSDRLKEIDLILAHWRAGRDISVDHTSQWSTQEWLYFITQLPEPLTHDQLSWLDSTGGFTQSHNAEITTVWLVLVVRYGYREAAGQLESFLMQTGRRKFLLSIYQEMTKTEEGAHKAKEIYARARSGYHFVATHTLDALIQLHSNTSTPT
jgi:aminopeptidase N